MLLSPKYYFHKKYLTCLIRHIIMTIVTKNKAPIGGKEMNDKCGYTLCKYYNECPHNKGSHYDIWGEGLGCKDAEERTEQMKNGDTEVLPW